MCLQCRGVGFDGYHLFVEADRRKLAEDTPERQKRDWEIVEAWYKAGTGRRRGRKRGCWRSSKIVLVPRA
jgi:hypothetical protein